MRCNPARWLWGLLPLAALIALTFQGVVGPIQKDLRARSERALNAQGLSWAKTGFIGREGLLAGRAPTPQQRAAALRIVKSVWGVSALRDETARIAHAKTYIWKAARSDGAIRLVGHVPNETTRRAILQMARHTFPNSGIRDDMTMARGAPPQEVWLSGISFGLRQLAHLEPGAAVDFVDTGLRISGRARSPRDYRRFRGALAQAVPGGIRVRENTVAPPVVKPYVWNLKRRNGNIEMSGYVPNAKVRGELTKAVTSTYPGEASVDKMTPGAGAPNNWAIATTALIRAIAPLKSADVKVRDLEVTVAGHVEREETAQAVSKQLMETLPPGFRLSTDIKFAKAAIPIARPFETLVALDERRLHLIGSVPSEDVKKAILARIAKLQAGRKLDNALTIARGQPEGWQTCFDAGLSALAELKSGRMVLRDEALIIEGKTVSEERAKLLPKEVRAAANRACRTSVQISVIAPPEPKLVWHAKKTAEGVLLKGQVPDSETRTAILAEVQKRFPNAKVDDQMRVSPASSHKWRGLAEAAIELLSRLRSGVVTIDRQLLIVQGETNDTAAIAAIRKRIAAILPSGYTSQDKLKVRSAAVIWAEQEALRKRKLEQERKRREAEDDERKRLQREKEAQRESERRRVFLESRRAELRRLQERREREALQRRNERARKVEERRKLREQQLNEERPRAPEWPSLPVRADRRPGSASRNVALRTPNGAVSADAAACQRAVDAAKASGPILFALASADLTPTSGPTLNKLAKVVRVCRNVVIDIDGHTDSRGSRSRNLQLSLRRARAVVDYLTKAGVPASRLNANGFGESRPIAPNTTRANRARNRRIEFKVRRAG